VTLTLQLILTGVALPWIEELCFRGYLLPRLSRYGRRAPLLGGLFFGLYHVWQLFSFPTVFLLGAALGVRGVVEAGCPHQHWPTRVCQRFGAGDDVDDRTGDVAPSVESQTNLGEVLEPV
jgi:hypothetical protein